MRDSVNRSHEFKMFTLCVVNQGHRRFCELRQIGDFTGVIHAEFYDADAVVFCQPQQGQRYADIVVQIAFGGEGLVFLEGPHDAGNHLRHGGFTVAACHSHQRQVKLTAPTGSQLAQGYFCVAHLETRQASFSQAMLRNGRYCTVGFGLR